MTAPVPDFDEAAHRYSYVAREYPSVTKMFAALGLEPPYPSDDPKGLKPRGTAIHRACDLAAWDRLDKARTTQELIPYVDGFEEKVREMNIRPIYTERRGVHLIEGYAGTLDLFCRVYDDDLAVIDYKTGNPPRCVELQTAGYGLLALYMESFKAAPLFTRDKMPRRFSMQLTPGRAIVRECSDPFDYTAFLGAVALYKWQQEKRKPTSLYRDINKKTGAKR